MDSGVRLLALGTDAALAQPATEAFGDAHQRQLKYASILDRYDMVVRTLGGRRRTMSPTSNFSVHTSASRSRGLFPIDAMRMGSRIGRLARSNVVSTEDPFLCGLAGYAIARRLGLPLSLQFAGDMIDNPVWISERRLNRWLNPLGKWLIRRAQTFRVVSTREREKLIGLGVDPQRVANIGWITDFGRFLDADGSAMRARWLGERYRQIVIFMGRLVPQKDLFTLIEVARLIGATHPDARFVLVGKGPLEASIRRKIESFGLSDRVVLAGPAAYDDVPAYLAAADVLALTTVYEGNARVLAEAAAAGRPAVTCDVSGSRDTVLDGESGYVVPVRDAHVFADRLSRLLDDPARAREMGARARQHVLERYDERRLLEQFQALWALTAGLSVDGSPL
ncbi:MAG TPA: glycosyltransferase [Chloroflexota bacterium]|nr:glycosyltransferase [Chloroflexota bacterium]